MWFRGGFPGFCSEGPWGRGEDERRGRSSFASSKAPPWSQWLHNFSAGGPEQFRGRGGLWLVALPIIAWLLTGFYRVEPDEQGVVLRFGAWTRNAQPGLNYHWPYPIETVYTPKVTVVNRIDSGLKGRSPSEDQADELYMLTGDKNILDVTFSVLWSIKDVKDFLFNTRDPQDTIRLAAESAVREVIAQAPITMALTDGRDLLNQKAQNLLQAIADSYRMGIQVLQVKLQDVNPPGPVIDAFRDVQSASADQERLQNQAEAYRRKVLPEARGQATRVLQEAEAYRQQVVNKALGEANRFLAVLQEYRKAKDVTTRRIYLETVESILQSAPKILTDGQGAQNVLPYLPLPELKKRASAEAASSKAQESESSSTTENPA